jgi:hypothetical protein
VTTDHFCSRAPDASRTGAASRGPFYFAWGCFRDFVSGLRGVPRRGAARRPGHEIVSASRSRRIDPTPMHHALAHRRDITHMILVTGAGGKTGVAVLKALVARGAVVRPAAYMQNSLAEWDRIAGDGVCRVPYPVDTRLSLVDLNDVAKAAALVLTEAGHSAASYGLVGRRPRARSRSPRGNPHVLGWLLKRPPTRWRHLPHGWPLTHEAANRSGASAARSSSPTGPVAPQNVDRRSGFPPAIRRWSARPARCRRAGSSA